MNEIPADALRENYNEISELCKKSGEPVFLIKNGKKDLVVMDIRAFAKRESVLQLREELLAAEEGWLNGEKGYSIEDLSIMMKDAVKETSNGINKGQTQPLIDKHQR